MDAIEERYQKKIKELEEELKKEKEILARALEEVNYDELPDTLTVSFTVDGESDLTPEEFEEKIEDIKNVVLWTLTERYRYEKQSKLMPWARVNFVSHVCQEKKFILYLTLEWSKPELKQYFSSQDLRSFIEKCKVFRRLLDSQRFRNEAVEYLTHSTSHRLEHYPDKEVLKRIGFSS